jgi:type I restriction-modification system DNA methylase subunit
MLSNIKDHIRNRTYMSGVERDRNRVKLTGEVFTPTTLVNEILVQIPIEQFSDNTKTFLDPSCGDGQFLGEVLIRKMENGSTFEEALSTTYGVDLMIDNVDLCRERLLCGREDLRHIVEQNIQCADGVKYKYDFKPMTKTRKDKEDRLRRKAKKEAEKQKKLAELEEQKKKEEAHLKKLFGKVIP